jgi:hypothetical protein
MAMTCPTGLEWWLHTAARWHDPSHNLKDRQTVRSCLYIFSNFPLIACFSLDFIVKIVILVKQIKHFSETNHI